MLFLLMFSDVTFHIETFSTNMTFTTLSIWLFRWKRHFRQCNVKSVKNISRRYENNQTPTKKHLIFFGSFLEIWIFQKFLQNPNKKLIASFLIITTDLILSLIPGPLVKLYPNNKHLNVNYVRKLCVLCVCGSRSHPFRN